MKALNKRILICMCLILMLFAMPNREAQAYTVTCTNCSNVLMQAMDRITNVSQLQSLYKEYAESIVQTTQQIEMVRQNVERYANMVKNTLAIPKNLIATIAGELTRFAQITNSLNTLRSDIMGLENMFDEMYSVQGEFAKLAALPRDMIEGRNVTIRANMDIMSERVDDATKATFQLSGVQLKDIEMSGQTESYINDLLSTPEGQMQALMSANQLTAMQLQEARQLRELMATRIQSDLASQMKAEKQKQLSEEVTREFFDMSDLDTTPHDDPPLF